MDILNKILWKHDTKSVCEVTDCKLDSQNSIPSKGHYNFS